ncbi:4-demethylwyosine synthase TYW1 [Sulfurisphaera ohwakuensis]|uniref:S-adenosyl-L-methionine-dependent tRNA 4-demethylwyosine synthase n=1 Tax=Sulfurisphaera ohwakuensis TaxID=69656 RepID=A0A650CHL3_SULOH|nr:4-demethylwyosine synthase TYW1 [Sulfurisphaera ohwakuensis]MBB5252528.1 tRNA wybutosine-synthesizing protein 1 [Sulfurisphaera ohwakuensis]QGR17027.1 4-demethylwyosine synthase TYW1 [Sulfurisphaera ohwakuensis]
MVSNLRIDTLSLIMKELEKEKYHIVGNHSVYKKCHWTHEALTSGRYCYKGKFYGIESHRCVQMSPTAAWCWFRCIHCWRLEPEDIGIEWDETKLPVEDDPDIIVEKSIEEHKRAVSGYFGREGVDKNKVKEAITPRHVAISLTGEPTLYDRLGELIKEYHKRGLTTFLVTSGVRPDILASLEEEPTQLFVSLQAPNEFKHKLINRPIVANSWNLVMKTLEILPSFSSPTVIRMTMIKGFNMSDEDAREFARLMEIAQPTYIEVKAYMHVGPSTYRLSKDAMPRHFEIKEFAKKLAEHTGYKILSEHIPSRIVLLSKLDKPIQIGNAWTDNWNWATKDIEDDINGEYKEAELGCTEGET